MEEKLEEENAKNNLNKSLYKLFLLILRYIPISLAINDIIYTILSYYNINCYFLSYIGGVSLIFIVILYIISYVFQFCYLYRFPLYYITVTNLVSLYDNHIGIPISDLQLIRSHFIILGIFIILFIYFKFKKKC